MRSFAAQGEALSRFLRSAIREHRAPGRFGPIGADFAAGADLARLVQVEAQQPAFDGTVETRCVRFA